MKAKREFLKERNFIDQFQGIFNSSLAPKAKLTFLFRVKNAEFEFDEIRRIRYDKVSFYTLRDKKFDNLRNEGESRELVRLFFDDTVPFLIAGVKVECRSEFEGRQIAKIKIENAINFISYRLGIDDLKLDKNHYLITKKFLNCDVGKHFQSEVYRFNHRELKKLNSNLYSQLAFVNKLLKNKLLFFEPKYQVGVRESNISMLWEYLENVIPLNKDGKKQVKKIASAIISLELKEHLKSKFREDFINAIDSFSPVERGFLPHIERAKLKRRKYRDIDVYESTKKSDHKFMQTLGKLYRNGFSRKMMKCHYDYIYSVMTEGYEYRNMEVHTGDVNADLQLKMQSIFIQFVFMFRVQCIRILNSHKSFNNFDKLLLKISSREIKKYEK